MTDMLTAIAVIWIFVFVYAVAASIDFGAGFWSMIYMNKSQTKATSIANRYLSPSWEVTNVFIVMVVVALFSFFPDASFMLGTVLLIPGSAIILLLLVRSAFMVYAHSVQAYRRVLSVISGLSGLLIPALLISVLPITEGGYIRMGIDAPQLDLLHLFSSPHEYAFIAFSLTSTLFLSSLLLADYADVSDEKEAFRIYRRDGIILGPFSLMTALLTLLTMKKEAVWLYDTLTDRFALLLLSVVCFLIGYLALLKAPDRLIFRTPRIAVVAVVVQYLIASYAYGVSHLPYIVYPQVTIQSGFTHPDTFRALFWVYLVGFAVLAPGFYFFWRMFLKDKRYVKQP